jgi:hypothetical protein
MDRNEACILNGGTGAWAFEPLAEQLAAAIGVEISSTPRRFNYVLQFEPFEPGVMERSFIPWPALELASDKRLMAQRFTERKVTAPPTELIDTFEQVQDFVRAHADREWCLKFPTGCGGNGHRMLVLGEPEPRRWPRPFIVQQFVRLAAPEVYRIYGAGEELFGWIVRRYAPEKTASPWVAHARGAHYETLGTAPEEAMAVARHALDASGLLESFGCVDLLQDSTGRWLALEVGTDGLFNHVDREINDEALLVTMHERIAMAFWRWVAAAAK